VEGEVHFSFFHPTGLRRCSDEGEFSNPRQMSCSPGLLGWYKYVKCKFYEFWGTIAPSKGVRLGAILTKFSEFVGDSMLGSCF